MQRKTKAGGSVKAQSEGSVKAKSAERRRSWTLKKKHAIAAAAIAVVIIIVFIYFVYVPSTAPPTSFSTFRNNFVSAPRAGILVMYNNGTGFASAIGCATSLIEQIEASPQVHRNSSTLDFYVVNQTGCVYTPKGLSGGVHSYNTTSAAVCLDMSQQEPTISINNSRTNSTQITPEALYVRGTSAYLQQCGIASEITTK